MTASGRHLTPFIDRTADSVTDSPQPKSTFGEGFIPIKKSGRPRHRFSDPVSRVQAWFWLSDVNQRGKDRSAVDPRFDFLEDLRRTQRLRQVLEDGRDPGMALVEPRGEECLLDYIDSHPGFGDAKVHYDHRFWKRLDSRDGAGDETALIAGLTSQGWFQLDRSDLVRARDLGLEWPETQGYLDDTEAPGFLATTPLPANLETLCVLLELFRFALDRAELALAESVYECLAATANAVGAQQFAEGSEARQTWDFVIRTRALAWIPDFRPPTFLFNKSWVLLREQFSEAKRVVRPGPPAVGPGESKGGKIEQRWRRRAFIHAGVAALSGERNHMAARIVRESNPFTRWLVSNRGLIDAHIQAVTDDALGLQGLDEIFDSPMSVMRPLPELRVPKDQCHRHVPPSYDAQQDEILGGQMFHLLFPASDDRFAADSVTLESPGATDAVSARD